MLKKTMLLATVVALVLSAAATALASSPGDGKAPVRGSLDKNELGKNKYFAGLVDIGGGRQVYMECRGKGRPTAVLVSGGAGSHENWTHLIDAEGGLDPAAPRCFPRSASSPGSASTIVPEPCVSTARGLPRPRCNSRPPPATGPPICTRC